MIYIVLKAPLNSNQPTTHPSTNRAQRRLTSLIETNDATTTPRRHLNYNGNYTLYAIG